MAERSANLPVLPVLVNERENFLSTIRAGLGPNLLGRTHAVNEKTVLVWRPGFRHRSTPKEPMPTGTSWRVDQATATGNVHTRQNSNCDSRIPKRIRMGLDRRERQPRGEISGLGIPIAPY